MNEQAYLILIIAFAYMLLLFAFQAAVLFFSGLRAIQPPILLSIVVPFKNEGALLSGALDYWHALLGSIPGIEVIFVNDHSTDTSEESLDALFAERRAQLLHLTAAHGSGKKRALLQGIRLARHPWVLTVDVDTQLNERMLCELLADPPTSTACAVIPVKPKMGTGFLSKLFDLEFMVLQVVGAGSALLKRPLLANGACFFFNREDYLRVADHRTDWEIPGGDDIFTMFAIAKEEGPKAVSAYISREPLAEAQFPQGLAALFLQRLRWVAKTPKVTNGWYTFVAWLVLGANAIFVGLWCLSLIFDLFALAWLYSCLKWIAEFALITWGVLYFRRSDAWLFAIPGLFIYPFYLCALVIASSSLKPKWKD